MTHEEKLKLAGNNKSIPSAEIKKDIEDTEREIIRMEKEAEGFALIGDRMSLFRRDARLTGINERRIFIEKLRAILEIRGEL